MLLASIKLDLNRQLDNDMFNHITYVSNRIFMMLKKDGVSSDMLERSGKYLWRLFQVLQAYNSKKQKVTLSKIIDIVMEFKKVFGA